MEEINYWSTVNHLAVKPLCILLFSREQKTQPFHLRRGPLGVLIFCLQKVIRVEGERSTFYRPLNHVSRVQLHWQCKSRTLYSALRREAKVPQGRASLRDNCMKNCLKSKGLVGVQCTGSHVLMVVWCLTYCLHRNIFYRSLFTWV